MVAILILLELTLQYDNEMMRIYYNDGRNPYFIGINSAIKLLNMVFKAILSRNPYFIGINSAMVRCSQRRTKRIQQRQNSKP